MSIAPDLTSESQSHALWFAAVEQKLKSDVGRGLSEQEVGVRLYQVAALADPARRDAFERLMSLADSHTVPLLLAQRLAVSPEPTP